MQIPPENLDTSEDIVLNTSEGIGSREVSVDRQSETATPRSEQRSCATPASSIVSGTKRKLAEGHESDSSSVKRPSKKKSRSNSGSSEKRLIISLPSFKKPTPQSEPAKKSLKQEKTK